MQPQNTNPQVDTSQIAPPPVAPVNPTQQSSQPNPEHEALIFLAKEVVDMKNNFEKKIADLESKVGKGQNGLKTEVSKIVKGEMKDIRDQIQSIING